jgi:hypothetical protein
MPKDNWFQKERFTKSSQLFRGKLPKLLLLKAIGLKPDR